MPPARSSRCKTTCLQSGTPAVATEDADEMETPGAGNERAGWPERHVRSLQIWNERHRSRLRQLHVARSRETRQQTSVFVKAVQTRMEMMIVDASQLGCLAPESQRSNEGTTESVHVGSSHLPESRSVIGHGVPGAQSSNQSFCHGRKGAWCRGANLEHSDALRHAAQ